MYKPSKLHRKQSSLSTTSLSWRKKNSVRVPASLGHRASKGHSSTVNIYMVYRILQASRLLRDFSLFSRAPIPPRARAPPNRSRAPISTHRKGKKNTARGAIERPTFEDCRPERLLQSRERKKNGYSESRSDIIVHAPAVSINDHRRCILLYVAQVCVVRTRG